MPNLPKGVNAGVFADGVKAMQAVVGGYWSAPVGSRKGGKP